MWWIAAAAAAVLLVAVAAYACYRRVFHVPRAMTLDPYRFPTGEQYDVMLDRMTRMVDATLELEYEDVYVTSRDGLRLHGRYYETRPGAPMQIMFHGYRSNAIRDYCGALRLAVRSGYNAILVDQRAHGSSEGRCLSFGVLERYDCADWIAYANARFGDDTPIVLDGISMGAATVLMAAGLDLPANVVGVISDCGYTSPEEIIRKVMRDVGVPGLLMPLIRLGARMFGGFGLGDAAVPRAMEHCRIPVLFIHGDDDRFVPCDMSIRNHAACAAPKRLLVVHGAGHGLSYMIDKDAYVGAIDEFLTDVVGKL